MSRRGSVRGHTKYDFFLACPFAGSVHCSLRTTEIREIAYVTWGDNKILIYIFYDMKKVLESCLLLSLTL